MCFQCENYGNLVNCDGCFNWYCLTCIDLEDYPKTDKWYCAFCSLPNNELKREFDEESCIDFKIKKKTKIIDSDED